MLKRIKWLNEDKWRKFTYLIVEPSVSDLPVFLVLPLVILLKLDVGQRLVLVKLSHKAVAPTLLVVGGG